MARARYLRLRLVSSLALVRARLGWALAVAFLATIAACNRVPPTVTLATTTSVANSGLLDAVLPEYPAKVQPMLVGSGRALEMLASGQADAIISHAPERESEALRKHRDWTYRKILYNDFVIVGPAGDPAAVRGSESAVVAMRRIAQSSAVFLSRGDESGTHAREEQLWRAAGVRPTGSRLVVAGAGMGQTLRVASSTRAYTLTDRGTLEMVRDSLALSVVFEGDPGLLNTYAVIADARRAAGETFAAWLGGPEGRRVLGAALDGRVRGFNLWPVGAPFDDPFALPRIR